MDLSANKQDDASKLYKKKLYWDRIIGSGFIHLAAIYGLSCCLHLVKWQTLLYTIFLLVCTSWSITAGAHRYFSHRSFEAKRPLQLLMIILFTMTMQNDVIWWARVHRQHHKFADTNADMHNINRGFIFAHHGWFFYSAHPEARRAQKTIDLSDLYADPALRFQRKYYGQCFALLTAVVMAVPVLLWKESIIAAFCFAVALRVVSSWHMTSSINSFAHMWGKKPYDQHIIPVDNTILTFISLGEGTHNYHHTFPRDYRASELGVSVFNFTTLVLDQLVKAGWVYNVHTESREMIEKRVMRTGDGSRPNLKIR